MWIKTGRIIHLYRKIGVAVVELERQLTRGTPIYIHGATTSYEQIADSIEVEHTQIEMVSAPVKIGLKLAHRARRNDRVYQWVPTLSLIGRYTEASLETPQGRFVVFLHSSETLSSADIEIKRSRRTLKRQQRRIAAMVNKLSTNNNEGV
jgi:DNA topoisomerase VI subunit B